MTLRTPALAKKLTAVALLAVGLLSATASAGIARDQAVLGFAAAPDHAAQGQLVHFTATIGKSGVRCTLSVRYADGAHQPGLKPAVTRGGTARWTFRVPATAAPGTATASATCGSAGHVERTFLVTVRQRSAPKLTIVKQGYTLRYKPTNSSTASFGVILKNTSAQEDALNVNVLINFVSPTNVVVGSVSKTIGLVTAGTNYNYGGSLDWQGYPSVARIETVVTVGAHAPTKPRFPGLANVAIMGSLYDPGYVGEVDGELRNEDKRMTLQNANLSVVILDAAGNVIGGGTGSSFAPVPPGARILFKAQNGFGALKLEQAASALITTEPTWSLTG